MKLTIIILTLFIAQSLGAMQQRLYREPIPYQVDGHRIFIYPSEGHRQSDEEAARQRMELSALYAAAENGRQVFTSPQVSDAAASAMDHQLGKMTIDDMVNLASDDNLPQSSSSLISQSSVKSASTGVAWNEKLMQEIFADSQFQFARLPHDVQQIIFAKIACLLLSADPHVAFLQAVTSFDERVNNVTVLKELIKHGADIQVIINGAIIAAMIEHSNGLFALEGIRKQSDSQNSFLISNKPGTFILMPACSSTDNSQLQDALRQRLIDEHIRAQACNMFNSQFVIPVCEQKKLVARRTPGALFLSNNPGLPKYLSCLTPLHCCLLLTNVTGVKNLLELNGARNLRISRHFTLCNMLFIGCSLFAKDDDIAKAFEEKELDLTFDEKKLVACKEIIAALLRISNAGNWQEIVGTFERGPLKRLAQRNKVFFEEICEKILLPKLHEMYCQIQSDIQKLKDEIAAEADAVLDMQSKKMCLIRDLNGLKCDLKCIKGEIKAFKKILCMEMVD